MVKITPETYKEMNEEFIREDIPFRIADTTQEKIDAWQNATPIPQPVRHTVDMVAEMWKEHRKKEQEESIRKLENEASDYGIGK